MCACARVYGRVSVCVCVCVVTRIRLHKTKSDFEDGNHLKKQF